MITWAIVSLYKHMKPTGDAVGMILVLAIFADVFMAAMFAFAIAGWPPR